jgi:hypothetical protein
MFGCLTLIFIGSWQLLKLTVWLTIQCVRLLIIISAFVIAMSVAAAAVIVTALSNRRSHASAPS